MSRFSMYEIIDKKKNGFELSEAEISWVIDGVTDQSIPDYQLSALLMAIFLKGMKTKEIAALTGAMLYSGETLSFEGGNVVDKHSTGGVGDKTSFILTPIASACGIKVPMIAGRALGHTGGTIDKIESIKGFKTQLSLKKFQQLLNQNQQVLIGQTNEIAPADRALYALRDTTATIDSIPLITASIMSKKLAEGANGIVMDIKVGSGAFMRNKSEARKLAKSILGTAKSFDRSSVALLTNMNQPLGTHVGNSLEIIESVEVLKGKGDKDLTELSLALSAWMIHLGGVASSYSAALKKAKAALKNGSALNKFRELIEAQGGDSSFIENYDRLPLAKEKYLIRSQRDTYLKDFACDQVGLALTRLGGGRKVKSDKIDFGVGFVFHKKIGAKLKKGDPILTIYHHSKQSDLVQQMEKEFLDKIIKFSKQKVPRAQIIYETIGS